MKQVYRLIYRTGWGEHCEIILETYSIITAQEMAKNYCKQNFIGCGWLYSPTGRQYLI